MAERYVEGARLSGQGHDDGTLVQFDQDVFPHVAGEIKRLNKDELKRVDDKAADLKLKNVYHEYKLTEEDKAAIKRDQEAAATAA